MTVYFAMVLVMTHKRSTTPLANKNMINLLLVSANLELRRSCRDDVGIGVRRSTSALAEKELYAVLAIGEGIVLASLGLELEVDLVNVRLLALDELSGNNGIGIIGRSDFYSNLASSSSVDDLINHLQVEGGTDGALLRGNRNIQDIGSSVGSNGAEVKLLTDVNGVGIGIINQLNENLDSDIVTKQVTNGRFNGVVEEPTKVTTRAYHSSIGNDVDEILNRLIHKINANRAQVQARAWGGAAIDRKGNGL